MGTTRKTITVTDQQNQWIKARITAGEFTNDSEYIRDLIRRDQEENKEIAYIHAKLIKTEQSGFTDKSRDQVLADIKERARANGDL